MGRVVHNLRNTQKCSSPILCVALGKFVELPGTIPLENSSIAVKRDAESEIQERVDAREVSDRLERDISAPYAYMRLVLGGMHFLGRP